jgi:ketosteroid isomerase-like protein
MRGSYRILLCLFALLVLGGGCTVYKEQPVRAFADATGGEGFERALWRDIQAQNWKDLDHHISSNIVYVTPHGRFERAAALEHIQQLRVQDFSIGDLQTEMNGDTFVVTYTIVLKGTVEGKPFPDIPERRMTVWQRQKSSWVAIAHSVVGLKQ